MRVGFVIEGGDALERNLATLGSRVEKGVIRSAVRKAQATVLRAARARALALHHSEKRLYVAGRHGQFDISMAQLLARNIVIAAPQRQIPGSYSLHVQMRRNVPEFVHVAQGAHTRVNFAFVDRHGSKRRKIGATVGVSYIPAAIEFGHGSDPKGAARPFMRPAAETTLEERKRGLARELTLGILREAIKGRYAASSQSAPVSRSGAV